MITKHKTGCFWKIRLCPLEYLFNDGLPLDLLELSEQHESCYYIRGHNVKISEEIGQKSSDIREGVPVPVWRSDATEHESASLVPAVLVGAKYLPRRERCATFEKGNGKFEQWHLCRQFRVLPDLLYWNLDSDSLMERWYCFILTQERPAASYVHHTVMTINTMMHQLKTIRPRRNWR